MKKVGVDAEWPATLFQNGNWHKSEKVWDIFAEELQKYDNDKLFEVVKFCENYLDIGKKRIWEISKSSATEKEKLSEIYDVFTQVISFVWLAHGFEHLYSKKLHKDLPKYMAGDIEKNIGDISFPIKKNAHYYFDQALKSDMPIEEVREKFGWIKARGGFADGFSIAELSADRAKVKAGSEKSKEFIHPKIPKELKKLAAISQELVYFRTLRTDVLYELMWVARPVLTEIAKSFGLTFKELRDYSVFDLLAGKLEKYEYDKFAAIYYGKEFALFHEPIILEKTFGKPTELKGAIAFRGVASGIVKVVMTADKIDKVEQGDILVAPTTAPSYIFGMKKAAAFVTDERGITSHAAIVSREMKKPCIIGTKIATKVLKDGDEVEVDAERGIVKILERE
ncbi:MAG: PEP-utilizing enzyme [Candidatus Gracilibacteria bacterium]